MAVGEGAGELRGDLGAIGRPRHDPESMLEHGHVEAPEMEDLDHAFIGEEPHELGRISIPADLDELGVAVSGGELHEAEPVAIGIEPERLGVDGDRVAPDAAWREVVLMQLDRHRLASWGDGFAVLGSPSEGMIGAQEKTRTSTPFRALAPEASASTSSATWARGP